jgi:hypothetical protein
VQQDRRHLGRRHRLRGRENLPRRRGRKKGSEYVRIRAGSLHDGADQQHPAAALGLPEMPQGVDVPETGAQGLEVRLRKTMVVYSERRSGMRAH